MAFKSSATTGAKTVFLNVLKELGDLKKPQSTKTEDSSTVKLKKRGKRRERSEKKCLRQDAATPVEADQCLEPSTLELEGNYFGHPVPELYPELSDTIEEEESLAITDSQTGAEYLQQNSEETQCVPYSSNMSDSQTSSQDSQSSGKRGRRKNMTPKKVRVRKDESPVYQEHKDTIEEGKNAQKLGSWAQCSKPGCSKWRFLKNKVDPKDIADKWVCSMNPDNQYDHCEADQEAFDSQDEDFAVVYTPFPAGAIVWAKLAGYPWWPAMMEDDPDYGYYCETEAGERVPISYHVVFFDKDVSRAWVSCYNVREFNADEEPEDQGQIVIRKKNYKTQLDAAAVQARKALAITPEERLAVYGFEKRFKGPIGYQAKKKTKRRSTADQELVDSLESSEELVSSGSSYNSSQENKKAPKKKIAEDGAQLSVSKSATKPIKKASDKGKSKPCGDGIRKATTKKSQGDTSKKAKSPKESIKGAATDTASKERRAITIKQAHPDEPTTQNGEPGLQTAVLSPDGVSVICDTSSKGEEKKAGANKQRKRKSQNNGSESSTMATSQFDIKANKKRLSAEGKPVKKKSQNEEKVNNKSSGKNDEQNTYSGGYNADETLKPAAKEKKTTRVQKGVKKGTMDKKNNSKDDGNALKSDAIGNKPASMTRVDNNETNPALSHVHGNEQNAAEAASSPVKSVKPMPKLIKPKFKPPSKTKASNNADTKPSKMPKLVKAQFVSPAFGKTGAKSKEVAPKSKKVKGKVEEPTKLLEEKVAHKRSDEDEEESSQPIVLKKAKTVTQKRAIESDDEERDGVLSDEMEVELAKLDKDIEDMKRKLTDEPDCTQQSDIDKFLPKEANSPGAQNYGYTGKTQMSTDDSPEF